MHLRPYFIDLGICLFALIQRKLAIIIGCGLEVGEIDITKLISTAVCFITGFTTLYRFVKEVKHDRETKRKKKAEGEAEEK